MHRLIRAFIHLFRSELSLVVPMPQPTVLAHAPGEELACRQDSSAV